MFHEEWKRAYEAGIFTEFMEHSALPGIQPSTERSIKKECSTLKKKSRSISDRLDFLNDPEAADKKEQLTGMSIACDAAIVVCRTSFCKSQKNRLKDESDPKRERKSF